METLNIYKAIEERWKEYKEFKEKIGYRFTDLHAHCHKLGFLQGYIYADNQHIAKQTKTIEDKYHAKSGVNTSKKLNRKNRCGQKGCKKAKR